MKYYLYNNIKIYVFMLTLKTTSNWRKENVKQNVINNPNINICYGIDGYDIELIKKIFKFYRIPLPQVVRTQWELQRIAKGNQLFKLTNYGKLGRWLSTIMMMKYSIDLGCHIILLEDDLLLPPNFDFQFPQYINYPDIVTLGLWGDGYYFTPQACIKFLQLVYHIGILNNDDNMIIDQKTTKNLSICPRTKYGVKDRDIEASSIQARNQTIDFINIPLIQNKNWKRLFSEKIFTNMDQIQEQFIARI